ncbi:MAG: TetR/AcrR family transcriptional regulator [Eggerthellaceae bacterium]|nr:TetR/AcrR family transcriptional regulator [Eggerthellaceae bacterium]
MTLSYAAQDKRIIRTKMALRVALINLIEEKGLDSISVSDLCAGADITRATFYNHYRDAYALAISLEDDILRDLLPIQAAMGEVSLKTVAKCQITQQPLPQLVDLFTHLKAHGELLAALLGPKGDSSFGLRLRSAVCETLINSILSQKYRDKEDSFVDYYVTFYAAAYLGVITQWISNGMAESPEYMARISMRLLFIKPGEPIVLK